VTVRIGQGVDVHAFAAGDHVVLGGVRIPHDRGLAAHSDGDVALHALCDALLGAAALGDIGRHFPPTEARWKGADSRDLLAAVDGLLRAAGWRVVNTDLTIVCERPRIGPHVDAMRAEIARVLGLDAGAVSVKATTTERLGFCGRGEGIAALAVALITDGA
jgi:2-C-methyl-D-erythritol 2,4-cyclodiphosphate synthase